MDHKMIVDNSINYIENNLREKINLSNLAKQSYFSDFYFHRLFHNAVGDTVMGYIRKRRLAEAAIDLVETNDKITDIALKYQFSSEESFSRAFKKMYVLTPREYRNTRREIAYYSKINTIKAASKLRTSPATIMSLAA